VSESTDLTQIFIGLGLIWLDLGRSMCYMCHLGRVRQRRSQTEHKRKGATDHAPLRLCSPSRRERAMSVSLALRTQRWTDRG